MVLTVTEDTPADMLAGSMELLVQLPRDHYLHTQRVTVLRSTPMMDLLVQIATAHKLTASNYTLQAIGEHGLVLPHHPNTPIGALDALQVKLLAKQGTCASRKVKQVNQPFETTFRLQVHLPRNQLYVSRVSPRMNLGEILDEVCREKNLDSSKYELRHPTNLEETLDLSLSLQDYQLQEVTLYAKQTRNLGQTLSTQDILALQRQEERRRQQTKQSVFGFMLKKSKESSLSMDSLGGRSVSPARSDETTRSTSPLQPPARPQRKRRPAPKPPTDVASTVRDASGDISEKDKMMINHSRNSSDSSGYHEASVLSDNPDTTARLPETLPRRSRMPGMSDTARRLAQTSQSSKSLGNLTVSGGTLTRGLSNTCLSSVGLRKKRAAPPPPVPRSISSAISTQTLERIVDSEESLTSDIDPSKSPSDIGAPSKVSSDIDCYKANSDICISTQSTCLLNHKPKSEIVMCKSNSDMQQSCTVKMNFEARSKSNPVDKLTKMDMEKIAPIEVALKVEQARIAAKRAANHDNPSEIESLLQKVSNTLSNALPISSSPLSEPSLPLKMDSTTASVQTNNAAFLNDFVIKPELIETKSNVSCMDFPMENTLDANMPNVTAVHLQQNTLDNVSAMNDNLSINDWKYQLPAPPSAFRDSPSPVFDDYDTVMIKSVQDFKKSSITVSDQADVRNNSDMNIESKNLLNNIDENFDQKISNEKIDSVSETEINIKRIKNEPIKQTSAVSKSASSNLQKEVISELENKLENGILVQTINKDFDRRNMDNLFAPQIAPVDNTLSNFTITTYTKPKSLDIFEEFIPNNYAKNSEETFIKTFATLSRNNTGALNNYDKKTSKFKKSDANNSDCKTELKIHNQDEPSHRWKSLIATNERNNIQRSKSYISMFSNAKNQIKMQSIDEKKHESHIDSETTNMKNATSITDFNINVRTNKDNFLEWRGNALKYQEEPTKEKRLQSLQVLKSILPQLRNVPQVEKNVSEEDSNTLIKKIKYETGSNEHSTKTNVVLTCEFREFEPQCKQLLKKEDTKRYAYAGPPEINLGSWSERPSANVQLKMDIDYKLGKSDTNKTVVNINNMKNEKDVTNYMDNISENTIDKNETKSDFSVNKNREKFTRKLIAHTTASGFKIPTSSRIDMSDSKTNEIKPIMIGNELKKTFVETPKEILRNDENEVDTTPLNFKELTKAYNQYINFKQNSKRDNINRHSADYCSAQVKTIEEITDSNVKQHNHIKLPKPTSNQSDFSCKNQLSLHDIVQSSQAKHLPRFTSIVGINDTSQNFELQNKILFKGNANNTSMKIPSMPVVKGFKISTIDSNTTNNRVNHSGLSSIDGSSDDQQLSKPPTMPVITGVTLKSTTVRSKSMPIQLDSRNMLLESIRNFGGHEKLKSAAKRY